MKHYSDSAPRYSVPVASDPGAHIDALIEQAENRLRQQRREMAASRFLVGLGLILAATAMGRRSDIVE